MSTEVLSPTICDKCGLMYQRGRSHVCPAKKMSAPYLRCPTCHSPRVGQSWRHKEKFLCATCHSYCTKEEAIAAARPSQEGGE